jgi:glycerol-3-phosphate acyltransferase PlsY
VEWLAYIVTGVAGYLLGSIPTGYLMAKARGIDIRHVGSGNIGATNVFRILGKKSGALVLLVDALKGYLACGWVPLGIAATTGLMNAEEFGFYGAVLGGVTAIVGHNYSCWLKFKGGKGIATSAGVMIALVPWALLIVLGVWLLIFGLSRYVSLASIVAAFCLPFAVWLTEPERTLLVITAVVAALAIYKHRSNIQRLIQGTEHRIGSGKKAEGSPG